MKKVIFAVAAVTFLTVPAFAQTMSTDRSVAVSNGRAPASALPRSAGADDATEATQEGQNKPTATGGQPGGAANRH